VEVAYVVEEVDLLFRDEEGGGDGVYGRISPSLLIRLVCE
jgi:hypothetical protein